MLLRFLTSILAVACLLLAGPRALAQTDTVESPMSILHGVYAQLDPAKMPHGVLFQTAFPLAPLPKFTGEREPSDSLRIDINEFGRVLFTLGSAVRDSARPALFDLRYRNHYAAKATCDHVELTGVLAAGGLLLEDAFANGWLAPSSDSTQLIEQTGMSATAYGMDTVFAFAPTVGMLGGTSVTWHFTDSLFYGNLAWPTLLQFDPGDGSGLRTVGFGDSLSVDYTGLDTARLELRLVAQGKTYRAYSWIAVPPQQRIMTHGEPTIITDVPGTTIEVIWADHECQEEFTNTLIVVDGIDPGDTTQNVMFRDDEGQGAYQKYELFRSNGTRISDFIQEKGYDFAFINFDDGGQSVETTAQILKAAIRYINDRKAAAGIVGDNIVIGHSMGGLTGKWALSEMARDGEAHGVSKFFSFDSPLRGAVVPLGVQLNLEYLLGLEIRAGDDVIRLRDVNQQFDVAEAILNSPATQELLVFSVDVESLIAFEQTPGGGEKEQLYVPSVDLQTHLNFQARFDALHPLDVPHIAIADGSRSSDQPSGTTDQVGTIEPGGLIYSMSIDRTRLDWIWPALTHVRTTFNHDATTRFAPAAYTSTTEVKVFSNGWARVVKTNQTSTSTHADFGLPHYDLAPGSHGDDGLQELAEAARGSRQLGITLHTDHYVFVPTYSALNLPLTLVAPVSGCGPGITECIAPDPDNLTSRFLDETRNFEHVTFSPRIATALLERIPELGTHEWSGMGVLPEVDRTYNFGAAENERTPNEITGERTVVAGGGFLVNRAAPIRFIDDAGNPAATSAHYDIFLSGGGCNEEFADITLESGAQFLVGELDRTATVTALPGTRVTIESGGMLAVDRNSDFVLRSTGPDGAGGIVVADGGLLNAAGDGGSGAGRIIADRGSIRVRSGGMLRASNSGQLIARNGGRIILEDGAIVQLWGGSGDESEATLWMQRDGTLEIQGSYTFSGNGFFQFDPGGALAGDGAFVLEGTSPEARRLRLNDGARLAIGREQAFRISNAEVQYTQQAALMLLGTAAIQAVDATFVGLGFGYGAALEMANSRPLSISRSLFVNLDFGIRVHSSTTDPAEFDVRESICRRTRRGVALVAPLSTTHSARHQPTFTDCIFEDNGTSIDMENYGYLRVVGGYFTDNKAIAAENFRGIRLVGVTVADIGFGTAIEAISLRGGLHVIGGSFSDCQTVIEAGNTEIHISGCALFTRNEIAVRGYGGIGFIDLAGGEFLDNWLTVYAEDFPVYSSRYNTFDNVRGPQFEFDTFTKYVAQPAELDDNRWLLTPPTSERDPAWFRFTGGGNPADISIERPENAGCGTDPAPCPEPPCQVDECEDPSAPCFRSPGSSTAAALHVRPNPTRTSDITIGLPAGGGTLALVDALGREVYRINVDPARRTVVIPRAGLTAGGYFAHFMQAGRAPYTERLVVNR